MKLFLIKKVNSQSTCRGCVFRELSECRDVEDILNLGNCDEENVIYKLESTDKL